ncbi:MAG: hypothetical protein KBH82_09735 [Syntrophorhabdaceae bacterium]|nr:hypothetical protein [Syntrophorhabdaceae bacterium]
MAKPLRSEGFKDSRIQGVKWFSWNIFQNNRDTGSRGERRLFLAEPAENAEL